MKSKSLWIGIAIAVISFFWIQSTYNTMVARDEGVQTAWSQVENLYQRRADLIPNLVNTVKGYASHESATLESVVAARAKATQITVDPTNLTEESLANFQQNQGELSQALGRLMMLSEAYPDLKASINFAELQAQLEGTENRIATERMRFNEAAQRYNTYIRQFPRNIISGMFGFFSKPYFKADPGNDRTPNVQF